ncbi:MAG: hypothetical protein AAFR93_13945, partial [Pseudomonadota bacterium]
MAHTRFFCAALVLSLGTALPAQGQSVEICATHRVTEGDHLFALAKTYYQNASQTVNASQAFALYSANRTLIGADPNALSVGIELQIPCTLDGVSLDQTTLEALPRLPAPAQPEAPLIQAEVRDAISTSEPVAPPTPAVDDQVPRLKAVGASMLAGPVPAAPQAGAQAGASQAQAPLTFRLLTGGPYAPFVGQDLPQGGLITDVIARALSAMEDAPNYDIAFVDDRQAHVPLLLQRGGFDLGFPWIYPDCTAPLLGPT